MCEVRVVNSVLRLHLESIFIVYLPDVRIQKSEKRENNHLKPSYRCREQPKVSLSSRVVNKEIKPSWKNRSELHKTKKNTHRIFILLFIY